MPDVYALDRIDAAILDLFTVEPRIGVLEASRRLHLARGTVQSRLDKLTARGVVRGWGPDLDPAALGYPVTAFLTLEIDQPGHEEVGARLSVIPEVIEVLTITGNGDLLCRVVARIQREPATGDRPGGSHAGCGPHVHGGGARHPGAAPCHAARGRGGRRLSGPCAKHTDGWRSRSSRG